MSKVVIAGAGQAAIQAATSLRAEGFEGDILLIADEPDMPYQKPPLSKGFLMDKLKEKNLLFKTERFYEGKNVQLALSERITALDVEAKKVITEKSEHSYDDLIIATGTRNRILKIEGSELSNIHYLRSLEDCNKLKAAFPSAKKMIVVGGGFIGLEIAAAAAEKEMEVDVIELQSRLMARVLPPVISDVFEAKHKDKGVRLHFNKSVTKFLGDGNVSGVELDDGTQMHADIVVVGIGVVPNDEFAKAAGIACSNGIDVNEFTQTNVPNVYAIGDIANHTNKYMNATLRLESVQNAMDQGKIAAKHITGNPEVYDFVPWFWTHQFELKLQMAGNNQNFDRTVIRGNVEEEKYSVFYLAEGKLIGVDSINRASDHMAARKLIQAGVTPTDEQIQDLDFKLKTIIQ